MQGPPLDNAGIADRLDRLAALLDLAGAGPYTARAYRRAAELIRATPAPVAELVRQGRARELRGIGPGIDRRLRELVETGEIAELRELEREVSPELAGLARFLGVSVKRMTEIGRVLGVRTLAELQEAAREGRLREVPGIGPETERKLLAALERDPGTREVASRPLLLHRSRPLVESIAEALGGIAAGDPRRWRDASERLAVVVPAERAEPVLEAFEALPQIVAVVERGERGALGVTVEGVPVELVVAEPTRLGTELVRATGSREWVDAREPLPDAADEEGVFAALGIPFVPPELREAGAPATEARLVEVADIRGDLHCHSTWSDGRATVYEMGLAARERGYEYLAICDHTVSVGAVPGLDADGVRRQAEEIAAANERLAPFRLLRGTECDIRRDGSLDLPDELLGELDWVQASVHGGQRSPREELTKRVLAALDSPYVSCLSHPTGRLINHRPPNAVDLEAVLARLAEQGRAVEVNGLPNRLDLRDEHVRLAREAGVAIVCSTDAHSTRGLGNIELSVATARRGGAAATDVLNTLRLEDVLARRFGA
ncbi:MAG TPA: helix-hairpin-helix domain-containing protein [Gaiellaceae bacterium]|nr:helix-hairpin-helix domain-containing protein [Gaiellaceae bacterium]